MTGSGSAIIVANGAKLTLKDSSPETTHKFRKDGHLLTLDENGSETVKGGVITGGTGTLDYKFTYGGCVNVHGVFAMEGGTIVGGQATYGGVYSNGQFIMNGGTIKGCSSSASGQYAAIYIGGREMLANDGIIEGTGALEGTIKTDTGKGGTTFSGHIKFYSPCIIEGGNFTGYAENWSGTIKGGTFSGTVSGGRIQGGNFVVKFDLNGGTPAEGENYADQTIAFQNQVTQLANPSKIGYTFDGWYIGDSDNKWDFEQNTVSAPMTLKAKWTDAEEPTGKIDIGTNK